MKKIMAVKNAFRKTGFAFLSFFLIAAGLSYAEANHSDTLVLYYSRTGKSALVAETLRNRLGADMLEIKDLKDRAGLWGFIGAALDSFYNRYTSIEPAQPDLSSYSNIVVVSPVWNWKLSVPIHTVLKHNNFEDKKLIAFTTANIDIKKYAHFGDDAPFVKRFLRDYLNNKRKEMVALVSGTGADISGHYHIATEGKPNQEIKRDTLQYVIDLKSKTFL